MRWSARITACLVRAGPIRCSMRGTLCQLMFMPSPISGTRIWASRAMTRKSSATESATPPPTQKPSMAPIVICSMSCQDRVSRGPSFKCRRSVPRSMVFRARPSGSLRSKPAVNDFAPPVSTTTEVEASSSKLRAVSVSCRIASGDSALMPSPRSNRTTAIRPSGPRPFSILTYSANTTSLLAFLVHSEMTGTLVLGLCALDRKTDRGADRDPVGVFASDVVAVDHVDRKLFARPPAYPGLKPRPHCARYIGRTGLAERFNRPLQGVGEFPVEADAIEQIVPVGAAVPQPAAVDVDPHGLGEPPGRRDPREHGQVLAGRGIERAAGGDGESELSDAGRHNVRLDLGRHRGAPLPVTLGAVGQQAQFDRLEGIDHAGRVGHHCEIGVGRRRHPALELAGTGFGNVGGLDRIAAVRRPRFAGGKPWYNCHGRDEPGLFCPRPHGEMLAESLPRHSPDFAPIFAP